MGSYARAKTLFECPECSLMWPSSCRCDTTPPPLVWWWWWWWWPPLAPPPLSTRPDWWCARCISEPRCRRCFHPDADPCRVSSRDDACERYVGFGAVGDADRAGADASAEPSGSASASASSSPSSAASGAGGSRARCSGVGDGGSWMAVRCSTLERRTAAARSGYAVSNARKAEAAAVRTSSFGSLIADVSADSRIGSSSSSSACVIPPMRRMIATAFSSGSASGSDGGPGGGDGGNGGDAGAEEEDAASSGALAATRCSSEPSVTPAASSVSPSRSTRPPRTMICASAATPQSGARRCLSSMTVEDEAASISKRSSPRAIVTESMAAARNSGGQQSASTHARRLRLFAAARSRARATPRRVGALPGRARRCRSSENPRGHSRPRSFLIFGVTALAYFRSSENSMSSSSLPGTATSSTR